MYHERPVPARRNTVLALGLVGATVLSGCTTLRTPEPVSTTRAIAAPTPSEQSHVTWQDELTSTPSTTNPPMFTVNAPPTTAAPTVTVTSVPTTPTAPPTTAAPRTTTAEPKPTTTSKTPTPSKTTPAPAKIAAPAPAKTAAPAPAKTTAPAPAKTTAAAPAPAPASGPPVTGCGNPNPGKVFLTFDDGGPMAGEILGILDRYGIKSRWFPTGQWASTNGAFISRLRADGQMLGNHTYSHPQMYAALGTPELQRQINLGYKPTNVFRFPYGASDATSRALVRSTGYSICGWNIDTNDWRGNSAATISSIVIGQAKPGSVVLMHMSFQSDIDALPGIIENLRGRRLI